MDQAAAVSSAALGTVRAECGLLWLALPLSLLMRELELIYLGPLLQKRRGLSGDPDRITPTYSNLSLLKIRERWKKSIF